MNSYRLTLGLSTVGYIHPTLYANAAKFNDVTSGTNNCCQSGTCCGAGFRAAAGMIASVVIISMLLSFLVCRLGPRLWPRQHHLPIFTIYVYPDATSDNYTNRVAVSFKQAVFRTNYNSYIASDAEVNSVLEFPDFVPIACTCYYSRLSAAVIRANSVARNYFNDCSANSNDDSATDTPIKSVVNTYKNAHNQPQLG